MNTISVEELARRLAFQVSLEHRLTQVRQRQHDQDAARLLLADAGLLPPNPDRRPLSAGRDDSTGAERTLARQMLVSIGLRPKGGE